MGNLCSKNTSNLSPAKISSPFKSSLSSIDIDHDFELHYNPAAGEGECLKLIFYFLGIPLKEVIHSDSQLTEISLYCKNTVQIGTFECLKYVSRLFKIYPVKIKDIYISDLLCDMIITMWRSVRGAFYHNDRTTIADFYQNRVIPLLKVLEKHVSGSNTIQADERSFGTCEALMITFIYNLFFIQDSFRAVLTRNTPKLELYCIELLKSNQTLGRYFESRSFHLYI